MKLEVGKKYVTIDYRHIKYVRIDCIREDLSDDTGAVVGTIFYFSNPPQGTLAYNRNGEHRSDENLNLVAEYKEPELNLGPEHVGMKVRHRNGAINLVVGFNRDLPRPVILGDGLFYGTDGRYLTDGSFVARDIIELLPETKCSSCT